MNGTRMAEVVNDIRITSSHKFVLRVITDLSFKNGYCWAFNEAISKMTSLSTSRVSHIITDLVRAGMLFRFIKFNDAGKVCWRELMAIPPEVYQMAKDDPDKQAKLGERVAGYIKAHEESEEERRMQGHVFSLARRLGLSPMFVVQLILKHGKAAMAKIEKVFSMAITASGIRNIYGWITSMMQGDPKPTKKAKREIQKPSHSVRVKTAHVSLEPKQKEEPMQDVGSAIERLFQSRPELAAKLKRHVKA